MRTSAIDRRGRLVYALRHRSDRSQPPEQWLCAERKRALLRGGFPQTCDEKRWQYAVLHHRAERRKADDRRG
jgi:hypothetical protein